MHQIMYSFFRKVGEKLAEYGFDILSGKMNLKSTLETLDQNLNSLSAISFDFEEKIKNAELFGKKKRKRQVEEWLKQVKMVKNEFHILESKVQTQGFLRKFFNGDQAIQLNAKVQKLVEQSQHFGELLVDVYETRGEALLTTNLLGKGFKENLKRILNLLKYDKVLSIGIYGMGGVGKTALARHINNIILEEGKEKRVCWITVSQVFSIKKLQGEIARFIGLHDLCDEDSEAKREARLNRAISLTGNNFILILDDLWEYICLQKLGDPLHLEGCKLILTTRSLEVCCRMGCQEKVEVKKLHTDEAWILFRQKLGQDIALVPEIKETAKSMVKVCGGLPLGIIVLAGSMRGETSIHVWRNELEKLRDPNMVQEDKDDEVFKIIKYSFDRLDSIHQLCFLNCSLYPEDFPIHKTELVKIFISVELGDIRKSRQSQLDQGHSILDKLLKACLLENEGETWVKMHDLVRAMALKITKGKNMVISGLKEIPNEEEWTKDLEKVSLMQNSITEIPDGMLPDCHNLKTLILSRNHELKFISDLFFSKLDSLCVLDLSRTNIKRLPNSLSNLENLKSLNLKCCDKLVNIPDLGNLKKLRELDLSETKMKTLPQGMEGLVNLRFLSLAFARNLDILPKGLFLNFQLLQCLRLPLQVNAPVEEIVRLKHLEEFWGKVENVSDFNEYIRDRQSQLTIFKILVSKRVIAHKWYNLMYDDGRSEAILPQCDLKSPDSQGLGLNECDLKSLDNQGLTLKEREGLSNSLLDVFSILIWPSSLKLTKMFRCKDKVCVVTDMSLLTNFTVEPPLPQASRFSSVRYLHIYGCNKMRKLGFRFSEFQILEEIFIGDCEEIEEIIDAQEGEGQAATHLKLKELRLWNMPRLSICNIIKFCGSIRTIRLKGCRELKKLPLYFDSTSHSPPQNLKQILVWKRDIEWWESLEWEHPTHGHLLQPLVKICPHWLDIEEIYHPF